MAAAACNGKLYPLFTLFVDDPPEPASDEGEAMSYLENDCKLIKEIELMSGIVTVYETDTVNEFLVRFEWEKRGKEFLFWRK